MDVKALVILACVGATCAGQFVFQHGMHPHAPHPPPPAHPVGSPQFPRFSKCMKSDATHEETEGKQWEWWQREYGCASLFASISVLAHSTNQPPTAQPSSSTSTTTQVPSSSTTRDSIKGAPEANRQELPLSEKSNGHHLPRYRSHRAGGLFAGVGLTSDFYAGGFGRYSRIAAAAQQDPFAWRYASPNDIRTMTIELPQHDALDDMTNERRRRDTQTCAEFRILAAKVVSQGPLESVCCNIICYCDELQNITASQDRCGVYDGPIAFPPTPSPSSSIPTARPPSSSIIDGSHRRHETVISSITEHELNGTSFENGTETNTSIPVIGGLVSKPVTESSTSVTQTPKASTASSTTDPSHVSSSSTQHGFPNDPAFLPSVKKVHEVLSGSLASEKARRPIWTPIMANGDSVYHSSTHRKSYQFGAPEEWGNFVHGDSSAGNPQGEQRKN